MLAHLRWFLFAIAICAMVLLTAGRAEAAPIPATILEMTLGDATTDVRFDGTNFFTVDESNSAIAGAQKTGILFLNFLNPVATDILTPTASLSLSGLQKSGQAIVVANSTLVVQQFSGGSFILRDDLNNVLLQGNLNLSALNGGLGNSTGGLFTTSVVNLTGGSLQGYIDPGSFHLSMNFTSIKRDSGDVGLAVTPPPVILPPLLNYLADLDPFSADATVDADASPVPEPGTIALVAICSGLIAAATWRQRR